MHISLFLTTEELCGLTGYQKPGRQITWLLAQGFTFRIAGDGYPRVDRSHYLKLMGGTVDTSQRRKTEPDFGGLLNLTGAT